MLGVHRSRVHCIADNTVSARMIGKLDMRQERQPRENKYFKRRWWDMLLYAILASEWQATPQLMPANWIDNGQSLYNITSYVQCVVM